MRNLENWKQRSFPRIIQMFSPRIQKDLQMIYSAHPLPKYEGSVFVYAPCNYGKTIYAASCILSFSFEAYMEERACTYALVNVSDLFMVLKANFGNGSEMQILEKYLDVDLLVVDDIGVGKKSDWAYDVFYFLINYRYENLKDTIITSNLSLEELATNWHDDRITSRISRMCKIAEKKHWKK